MHTGLSDSPRVGHQTELECPQVLQLVEQIKGAYFLDSTAGQASDQVRTQKFLEDLNSLGDRLRDHFQEIEHGDGIQEAVHEAPHMATVAAELESLRQDLWNYLERIGTRVDAGGIAQAITANLESEFNDFYELLYDYQQAVDQILGIDEFHSLSSACRTSSGCGRVILESRHLRLPS